MQHLIHSADTLTFLGITGAAALLLAAGLLLYSSGDGRGRETSSAGAGEESSLYSGITGIPSGDSASDLLSSDVISLGPSASSSAPSAASSSSGSGNVVLSSVQPFRLGSFFNDAALAASGLKPASYAPGYSGPAEIASTDTHVELRTGTQKVAFDRGAAGDYVMKTYILKNGAWTPFYDAGLPLVQGRSFGGYPTSWKIIADSAERKAILLSGVQAGASGGFEFEIEVEVTSSSPLIHITVTSYPDTDLTLSGAEPRVMLWRSGTGSSELTLNQEVPNYQTLDDSAYWKSGFPATYLYTDGMESAVYFNMTPMDWYSFHGGVRRFQVSQARTVRSSGMTGSGMDLRSSTDGAVIRAGKMTVDFYLYGDSCSSRPSKLQALGRIVSAFGSVLPSSAPWPANYVDPSAVTYRDYAARIAEGLMAEGITYRFQPVKAVTDGARIWKDGPLFLERTLSTILQRPGYALKNASGASSIYGDWNCNNNTLIPWLIYERLNPDAGQHTFLNAGLSAMPAYYDKQARLIRSFEEQPGYTGNGVEFTFQNFFMQQSTLWASYLRDPQDFDPALGGKFLLSMQGMTTLAHNCSYVFPQLFSASALAPAASLDEPAVGTAYEAWSGAIYSYNMCLAYDLTADRRYLTEASVSLDKLFTDMSYYANSQKLKRYTDPYDFPVNEVSSAPWGVAAANMLYYYTGEAKWLTYANDIRNLTLRMMNWYESMLRDDTLDKSVASLALFHAFSVTDTTCTWENAMTYLPMILSLKNPAVAPDPLLLKLYNLYRINAFYFCGPSWNPAAVPTASSYTSGPAGWLAVEDYYSAETPTPMGANGPNTYMSNGPLYDYILFEAYAEAENRSLMAMNLDIVDAASKMAEGAERNFILYNSTGAPIATPVLFHDLKAGLDYQVTTLDSKGRTTVSKVRGSALMSGLSFSLAAHDYARVSVICLDRDFTVRFTEMQRAQKALIIRYAALQEKASSGVTETLTAQKERFRKALAEYDSHDYSGCLSVLGS